MRRVTVMGYNCTGDELSRSVILLVDGGPDWFISWFPWLHEPHQEIYRLKRSLN